MQPTTTVQMNARIDSALKEAGDRVLGALGYTPTQAVRGMWQYVVDHRDEPRAIERIVQAQALPADVQDRTSARLQALKKGQNLCATLGPLSPSIAEAPYEELRDAMYDDRYARSL